MSRTLALRKQHDAIVVLAEDISHAFRSMTTSLDAERLHRLLRQLDTILKTHLASEDRVLYPQMLASGNGEAATVASRFCEDMGGIMDSYVAFAERWTSGSSIFEARANFGRDWRALCGALAKRVELENTVLYPLADAMTAEQDRRFG